MPRYADGFAHAFTLAVGFLRTITAANTLAGYQYDLFGCNHDPLACEHPADKRQPNPLAWLRWCASNNQDPLAVRATVIQFWLTDLATAGQAEGTGARRLSAVASWYRWLWREDQIPVNPVDKIKPSDRPQGRERGTAGTALSHHHAIAIVDAAGRRRPPLGGPPLRSASTRAYESATSSTSTTAATEPDPKAPSSPTVPRAGKPSARWYCPK